MFRVIILPIFKNARLCVLEDGQNNFPKHVELTGIINKPLLLHLVGCLYYLYQWYTVKQISDNEIYLLIKYIKSVLSTVAKRLSYIETARCLKDNNTTNSTATHTESRFLPHKEQTPFPLPTSIRPGTEKQKGGTPVLSYCGWSIIFFL